MTSVSGGQKNFSFYFSVFSGRLPVHLFPISVSVEFQNISTKLRRLYLGRYVKKFFEKFSVNLGKFL